MKCDEEGERVFPAVIRDDRRHDPDTGAAGAGTTHQYKSKVSDEMLLRGPGLSSLFIFEKSPTCIKYTVVVPAQEGYSCPVSERSLVQDDTSLEDTDQHFTCGNTFSR